MRIVTSRAFNQDPSAAKRAASAEPVQITERGKVSHVLLSIEKYQEITGGTQSIVDMLAMPNTPSNQSEIEFPKLDASSIKPAEFD